MGAVLHNHAKATRVIQYDKAVQAEQEVAVKRRQKGGFVEKASVQHAVFWFYLHVQQCRQQVMGRGRVCVSGPDGERRVWAGSYR